MATLGPIFKEAREKKKITQSKAALATRMKVQTLIALEEDDYRAIPAAMYAKGFIKIYANYLGLDPQPLLQMYTERHGPRETAGARPAPLPAPARPEPATGSAGPTARGGAMMPVPAGAKIWLQRLRFDPAWLPSVAVALGGLVILVLLIAAVRGCSGRSGAAPADRRAPDAGSVLRPPPEPYLELPATNAAGPRNAP